PELPATSACLRNQTVTDSSLRLAWLTDAHLSLAANGERASLLYNDFVRLARRDRLDAVLTEGTLAEISSLVAGCPQLRNEPHPCPILFTVREAGFSHNCIADFQRPIKQLCKGLGHVYYLGAEEEPVAISKHIALVGHDGWADSRFGLDDSSDQGNA